eukprot:TRINITY_DN2906_c0_g2_i1.p2 TRINITY_DN2906_c0_g2~~TRINITY_DN2906_c0_g2_i1.p2  ORF type:complete len:164 (+),score=66.53 TRINITY_DN2906_c0_g2_i1:225-716(+)
MLATSLLRRFSISSIALIQSSPFSAATRSDYRRPNFRPAINYPHPYQQKVYIGSDALWGDARIEDLIFQLSVEQGKKYTDSGIALWHSRLVKGRPLIRLSQLPGIVESDDFGKYKSDSFKKILVAYCERNAARLIASPYVHPKTEPKPAPKIEVQKKVSDDSE